LILAVLILVPLESGFFHKNSLPWRGSQDNTNILL
jgi:hypothetical protein